MDLNNEGCDLAMRFNGRWRCLMSDDAFGVNLDEIYRRLCFSERMIRNDFMIAMLDAKWWQKPLVTVFFSCALFDILSAKHKAEQTARKFGRTLQSDSPDSTC